MPVQDKVVQLRGILETRFFQFLPEMNRPNLSAEQRQQNRLSRSLAALAVAKLADVDDSTGASSVIDGYDDNGVDAIYFDRNRSSLFLVQSKYKKDGGEPDFGETKKFADGIRDLLAKRYERFNEAFHERLTDVDDALEQPKLKIVAVLAYTGNSLGQHARREIDDLLTETNKFSEILSFEHFTLDRIHTYLVEEHSRVPVNIELTLENWYRVSSPLKAFYGQVSANQLAQLYHTHVKALFERNIRYFMGSSAVNSAITQTVQNEPGHLFYLNNGLTAICSKITPKPTASPDKGSFVIEGFSIVNGAQTVGSIATASSSTDLSTSPAKLLITLIELAEAPDDFGTRVTHARNYQNQVRLVDFVALDPFQERLRRELAVLGITYHYKPSLDAHQRDDSTFIFQEAAIALACFSGKTEIVITLKKEIGKILDRQGNIYAELFKSDTSAVWVCRAVRTYRFLDNILTRNEWGSGRYEERMFYRHARFFILHILARKSKVLRKPELILAEEDKIVLSRELNEYATLIFNEAEKFRGAKGYLALSRNQTDGIQLADRVMHAINSIEQTKTLSSQTSQ